MTWAKSYTFVLLAILVVTTQNDDSSNENSSETMKMTNTKIKTVSFVCYFMYEELAQSILMPPGPPPGRCSQFFNIFQLEHIT